MKNCVLCYKEIIKCNSDLKLFKLCRLYLHSSLTQETCNTASEEWNLSFCTKCLESTMELDKLSQQLKCIQKSVSEFTFTFGLEILQRRGEINLSKTDENPEHYLRQKSAEFDVSAFPHENFCSPRISNCTEAFDSTSEEAISEIVDEIDPLAITALTEEASTSEVTFETIKIEKSEQSSIAALYDGIRIEDAGSENILPTFSNENISMSVPFQCINLIPTVKLAKPPSKPNKYGEIDGDLIISSSPSSPALASSSSSLLLVSPTLSTALKRRANFSYPVDESADLADANSEVQAKKQLEDNLADEIKITDATCPDCQRKFWDNNTALRHYREIHKGLYRPKIQKKCLYCEYVSESSSVNRHMKAKHGHVQVHVKVKRRKVTV